MLVAQLSLNQCPQAWHSWGLLGQRVEFWGSSKNITFIAFFNLVKSIILFIPLISYLWLETNFFWKWAASYTWVSVFQDAWLNRTYFLLALGILWWIPRQLTFYLKLAAVSAISLATHLHGSQYWNEAQLCPLVGVHLPFLEPTKHLTVVL